MPRTLVSFLNLVNRFSNYFNWLLGRECLISDVGTEP